MWRLRTGGRGGGEGGSLKNFLYGEAPPPNCPTPCAFMDYWRTRNYLRIPSVDKWYPLHVPGLELYIPFNCYKCTIFEIWINHKARTFSGLFLSHNIHLLVLVLGLFTERNDRVFTTSYNSTSEIATPSEEWKKVGVFGRNRPVYLL